MIDAHAHPTRIGGQIVDAIGGNLTQFGIDEVMNPDCLWFALGLPFPACIFGLYEISRGGHKM